MATARLPTLDLLLPGLLPAPSTGMTGASAPRLPALERLLARSDRTTLADSTAGRWLMRRFDVPSDGEMPAGALSLLGDGGSPGEACWLRADPVHLRLQRDQLVLADHRVFGISQGEAEALTDALNRHFASDGLVFYPLRPERWYLRTATVPAILTTPLAEAVGCSIDPILPRGPDALTWHRLGNEIQMLLHGVPQNMERESRGMLAVNSVWLWGAGILPTNLTRPYALVLGDDPLAGGLARAAGCEVRASDENAGAALARPLPGDALWCDARLDTLHAYGDDAAVATALRSMEERLFAPALDALKRGRIDSVRIVTFSGNGGIAFTARRSGLLRFWRTDRKLSDYASA